MTDVRTRVADRLLVSALVAVALAWPLASPPIGTHGEAREGLVIQTVVHEGRWVLPLRNGEVPSKPPLFHWIAGAVGSIVGLSDAIVRLPSALAAWVALLAVYGLGVAAGGRRAGWLAVGALAGMHTFLRSAGEARVDMLFTACVTVTLAAFLRWYRSGEGWAHAATYFGAAAAVLTKGPAGAVLPALVILVFLAVERRLDLLRSLWSWRLATLALVVDLGWYASAAVVGGEEFLHRQIFHENVDRFVGRGVFGLHGGRSRLVMAENLATDLLPWNLVLAWSAVRWWRGEREDAIGRFLHCWWITILVFFTVAYGKRGVYLLPLYPAVAVLAGRGLAAWIDALAAEPRAPSPLPLAAGRLESGQLARVLVGAVLVLDVALIVVGQAVRVHKAARKSLVPFAHEVAAAVPSDAALVADPSLEESDRLVLAYRLSRTLPRQREGACTPGTRRLTAARPGERATVLARSERRGVAVALVEDTAGSCTLALENGRDR